MKIYKKPKGLSLIEAIVSMTLLSVFAALFFFNFPVLNSATIFNARVNDIASSFRLIQSSGSSRGGMIGDKKIAGDGIYMVNSSTTDHFNFFYDVESVVNNAGSGSGNKIYDADDVENVKSRYDFKDAMFLYRTRLHVAGSWYDMQNNDVLSIVYNRPEIQANISASSTPGIFYDSVCIELIYRNLSDTLNKKSVTISKFGQVNSYNTLCN